MFLGKNSTKYKLGEYEIVLDNFSVEVLQCSNKDIIGCSLKDDFIEYLGKKYIDKQSLSYIIGKENVYEKS